MNGFAERNTIERVEALERQQRRDLDLLRHHLTQRTIRKAGHSSAQSNFATRNIPWERQNHEQIINESSVISSTERNIRRVGSISRVLFLDPLLAVLFLMLLGTYHAKHLYEEYFVHILAASSRASSDTSLLSEYTYYERSCSVKDMSTHDINDLLITNETSSTEAIDIMMKHGATVIPQVLQHSTVQELRTFILRRNSELTDIDSIFVSQGDDETRVSFGIDATDDPIVHTALREIATNNLLQPLMEGLVGSDPAITEITAITARYGAIHQTWHQDVKADGNAVKFARTFSHSYSMFVALQDITSAMGATEICPGTHYCANELHAMCDANGIQLNEAAPDKLWHAGDAALLNQQIWHRGYEHSDPHSLERILFIVSFIGRPQHGVDTRQLARGTYFHMKWNMWGHTWMDLLDARRNMAKPFSIFRSLGIWKPSNRNWGYDLVTSGIMRIANAQMGFHWSELPDFVDIVTDRIRIPKILQGVVLKNDRAWETYLRETTEKWLIVLLIVNLAVMVPYCLAILLLTLTTRTWSHVRRATLCLALTHILPAFWLHRIQLQIASSRWGQDVKLGYMLNEPFDIDMMNVEDSSLAKGPTTLPESDDVLIGSRFDATFLGSYDRWLDYHPGNAVFRTLIAGYAPFVKTYEGLPDIFSRQLTASVLESITGRLLEQDWRNGQWRRMSRNEKETHVRTALSLASSKYLKALHKGVALQLAHYRFDVRVRHTAMSHKSQVALQQYLLKSADKKDPASSIPKIPRRPMLNVISIVIPLSRRQLMPVKTVTRQRQRWTHPPPPPHFVIEGDIVAVNYNGRGKWFRGSVGRCNRATCQVLYDDGDFQNEVPLNFIRQYTPLEEGALVQANSGDTGTVLSGVVDKVMPSGHVNILYHDGSSEQNVSPSQFDRLDV